MDDLERVLRTHPFIAELAPEHVQFLVGCAKNLRFRPGEYLLREGDPEDTLFLIRQGTVAVEIPGPGGSPISIETIGEGDVLGVSLMTARAAHLDCRARETVLAIGLDKTCLLGKMEEDTRLGYAISMHLLERTYTRLARSRLQHLDAYR